MGIVEKLAVCSEQRDGIHSGGGNDHLIHRIAVKLARQLGGLYDDFRRQVDQLNALIGQRLLDFKRCTGIVSCSRPSSTSLATSQHEMMLIPSRWF